MQLAERRPIKRHALEAFDYARLFDGRAWRITPADYGDRTQPNPPGGLAPRAQGGRRVRRP